MPGSWPASGGPQHKYAQLAARPQAHPLMIPVPGSPPQPLGSELVAATVSTLHFGATWPLLGQLLQAAYLRDVPAVADLAPPTRAATDPGIHRLPGRQHGHHLRRPTPAIRGATARSRAAPTPPLHRIPVGLRSAPCAPSPPRERALHRTLDCPHPYACTPDRQHPRPEIPAAIAYLEQGHAKGKVVVGVA
jgi:hypothetical protein